MRIAMMLVLFAVLAVAFPAAGADISGTWAFTVESPAGTGNPVVTFTQDGEKLTGTYKGRFGESALRGTLKGDKINFSIEATIEGAKYTFEYTGTVSGGTSMKGTVRFSDLGEGTWSASKKQD